MAQTRYIFTNLSNEDIFLSGANVTIKAGQSITLTPVEIDDIEEYYDYPEVVAGKLKIDIIGGEGQSVEYRAGAVVFNEGEDSKLVTFSTPMPDTNYSISIIADDNVNVYYQNKTNASFVACLSAPPQPGNTITINYVVIKYQ
jgi:hypothetical protein